MCDFVFTGALCSRKPSLPELLPTRLPPPPVFPAREEMTTAIADSTTTTADSTTSTTTTSASTTTPDILDYTLGKDERDSDSQDTDSDSESVIVVRGRDGKRLTVSMGELEVASILSDLHDVIKQTYATSLAVVGVMFLVALAGVSIACSKCSQCNTPRRCCIARRRRQLNNPAPRAGDMEMGAVQEPDVTSTSSEPPLPPLPPPVDQSPEWWPPATVAELFSFSAASKLPPSSTTRYSSPWQQQQQQQQQQPALTTVVNAVGLAPVMLPPPAPLPDFTGDRLRLGDSNFVGERLLVADCSTSSEEGGFCGVGAKFKKK